jgi:hypothetical protein
LIEEPYWKTPMLPLKEIFRVSLNPEVLDAFKTKKFPQVKRYGLLWVLRV